MCKHRGDYVFIKRWIRLKASNFRKEVEKRAQTTKRCICINELRRGKTNFGRYKKRKKKKKLHISSGAYKH